jgi:hypothetical protein
MRAPALIAMLLYKWFMQTSIKKNEFVYLKVQRRNFKSLRTLHLMHQARKMT